MRRECTRPQQTLDQSQSIPDSKPAYIPPDSQRPDEANSFTPIGNRLRLDDSLYVDDNILI